VKIRHVALIYDATLPYDLKIIEGVAAYVQEVRNWSVYIEEYSLQDQQLPDLHTWPGDGILADFDHPKVPEAACGLKIPVVGFGGGYGWYDPASGIPYFATDNTAVSQLAAEHLLDRGFRRFAFCGYPRTPINGWSEERARAFQEYLRKAGFPCFVYTGRHRTARSWGPMQESMCRWLKSLEKPLGLMAATDKRARHVLEACKTLGLRVPEEVAVIGVDNDEMLCRLATPPLSSVNQGTRQLGYRAAALLDQMMAGNKSPQLKYLTPPEGIVCRRSTDVLAIEDSELASVIRFIYDHACKGIKVRHVVEMAGVSRSTLESRFETLLGRSIHTEIRRIQIERAKELVRSGDLPLKQIAQLSGFTSVQYMTYLFHRSTGQTPAEFRRLFQQR
jgi:LacI family transcriptional regulator